MLDVPLELRILNLDGVNGVRRDVSAISEVWRERRVWSQYRPPPMSRELSITGALDGWLEQTERVLQDLVWLLRTPCHKFWSQILFDQSLQVFLESILQQYPREYDEAGWDESVQAKSVNLLHKLFLVFLRLCTFKESASDFFSPTYYADMIYDKFIIDLPKIIDMCSLFRSGARGITQKMVENIFKVQPKYTEDLYTTGETLGKAFENVGEQFQTLSMSLPSRRNVDGLCDLVGFVIDISSSTFALLDIYPAAAKPLQLSGFELKLSGFYHSTIVGLQDLLDKFTEAEVLAAEVSEAYARLVQLARHCSVLSFRAMVDFNCLQPVLSGGGGNGGDTNCDTEQVLEDYLCTFTSVLEDRTFLVDYNTRYPISEDFHIFEQAGLLVDQMRKHYILDAFCQSRQESVFSAAVPPNRGEKEKGATASVSPREAEEVRGAAAAPPTVSKLADIEIVSMISSVRDMLPYLGEGFVEACLQHYQFKAEEVVNAILEANLPPHLASLDQSMEREPVAAVVALDPFPPSRCVFDNDEFDVNARDDIDLSRIHRGKKNKIGDAKKLLNDKTDINSMRERFSKLGIVTDFEVMAGEEGEYEDEYDDTYDDVAVGEEEPDSRDDQAGGRKFVLPVALGGGKIGRVAQGGDDEEDEEEEEDERRQMNFVRNPEEVRQEKERLWQEKTALRGRRQKTHQPVRDVIGKPKGQGQDKQVLINRARKNANKGKSQRMGAENKQSKGMF